MNVRIEAEPNQDCPHNFDNAVCHSVDCGYGQCVPTDDGSDYECLCNNCFLQQSENGKKSCVKDPLCFFKNPCLENPCECGGQCTPCPECSGNKFTCTCPSMFTGETCGTLNCPAGFVEGEISG